MASPFTPQQWLDLIYKIQAENQWPFDVLGNFALNYIITSNPTDFVTFLRQQAALQPGFDSSRQPPV